MSARKRFAGFGNDAVDELYGVERVVTPEEVVPWRPKTLGPGDDDGKDRGRPLVSGKPLGPGDDDGVDRGKARDITPALGPGDADPNDKVDRNFRMLAQPAPGPGETFVQRRVTVVPNKVKE